MSVTNMLVKQGATYKHVFRWGSTPIVYKAISAITKSAPARLTVAGHGLVDGWPAAVTNAKGMTEINAEANKVRSRDYHPATVLDGNTVEFNDVDAAGFKEYTGGGYLQYNTPVDLAGFTARMAIKNRVGGTVLLTATTENGKLVIDNAKKTITLILSESDTAGKAWRLGVFDLEMIGPTGEVTAIADGEISLKKEVTT